MENATMLEARCRSREGAWIEILGLNTEKYYELSRSREGAWIEMTAAEKEKILQHSRSREGAWIEILQQEPGNMYCLSLPQGSVD